MSERILELKHITKTFPGGRALDDVHFGLKHGEIHSLIGEIGAGKSTLIKVITGVYQPDAGEIVFDGKPVEMRSTADSQRIGTAAIYQHVACYPDLSVTENIFIGHEKIHPLFRKIDWVDLHGRAEDLLRQLDADFDPRATMGSLSVAQQQIVEIAKALSTNARIIIMDEPTAPLTSRESEDLYRITESLRDKGVSIIFISHRMEDMYRLATRVTVFRDARYVGTWRLDEIRREDVIMAMVGREITQFFPKRAVSIGEEIFKVEGLSRTGSFKDVSFSVRKGEILAMTGLIGAGRTEVCEAIYGVTGADLRDKSVSEAEALLQTYPNLKCIIAPTTVGIAAAGKVITDKGLIGKVLVTGLGLPSEMAMYIENGACPYMFLWNLIDVGYLGAYTGTALVSGKITGAGRQVQGRAPWRLLPGEGQRRRHRSRAWPPVQVRQVQHRGLEDGLLGRSTIFSEKKGGPFGARFLHDAGDAPSVLRRPS